MLPHKSIIVRHYTFSRIEANFLAARSLEPIGTLFRILDDTTGPSAPTLGDASCWLSEHMVDSNSHWQGILVLKLMKVVYSNPNRSG